MEPTWKDLFEFIQNKIAEEGESFLENKIYIEMQDPKNVNKSFKTISDSEGWQYTQPAWSAVRNEKPTVMYTYFKKDKICTLNINY